MALVFDPTASSRSEQQHMRRTLDGLAGKVVGFIDNAKPNFKHLVDDLAELLVGNYGVTSVIKRSKPHAAMPASDTVIEELAWQCDLVITGSGD